jgi:hypothetical protein
MRDVLFQTDRPTAVPGRVEFYDLRIVQTEMTGRRVRFVREVHGWWDNTIGRAVVDEGSTFETEAFTTHREAFEHYCRQRLDRAKAGFQHTFIWHPISGAPSHCGPDGHFS